MLTSLFGDLRATRDAKAEGRRNSTTPRSSAAARTSPRRRSWKASPPRSTSAARSSTATSATWSSPARRRRRSASTSPRPAPTSRPRTSMITLLDPVGVWASSVVKALSDAGGRPIEKLHLREQSTLRTIAMIERTTLVRRQEDTLRIFHADVRAPGPENAEIPVALMERSQMTAVIIGPMQPHAIDALLDARSSTRPACRPGAARTCCSSCRRTRTGSTTRSRRSSGRSGCTCTSSASR